MTFEALRSLLTGGAAERSPVGIGVAVASLIVMPLLVRAKRRTGRELGSATVLADSTQTMLCASLPADANTGQGDGCAGGCCTDRKA